MTKTFTVMFGAALALSASLPAAAQSMSQQEEAAYRRDCTGDYMRLCAMHAPDSPMVQQCFETNMKNLSPSCQKTIATYSRSSRPKR